MLTRRQYLGSQSKIVNYLILKNIRRYFVKLNGSLWCNKQNFTGTTSLKCKKKNRLARFPNGSLSLVILWTAFLETGCGIHLWKYPYVKTTSSFRFRNELITVEYLCKKPLHWNNYRYCESTVIWRISILQLDMPGSEQVLGTAAGLRELY